MGRVLLQDPARLLWRHGSGRVENRKGREWNQGRATETPLMRNYKVALCSTSVGAGHTRAAKALEAAADGLPITIEHRDTLDLMPRAFRKLYRDGYLEMVDHAPEVFSWLFDLTDKPFRPDSVRMALEEASARRFHRFLDDYEPDLVLCTHFLPATLAHQRREKGKGSYCLATVVTDFDVHGMWLGTPSDHYFLAVPEARAYLRSFGVSSRAISVTGIPTDPVFSEPTDRAAVATELGLRADLTTLLLSAGGLGTGKLDGMLDAIAEVRKPLQVVAACGRNQELLEQVEAKVLSWNGKGPLVHAIGFSERFHDYMACADLMLGKPGGLTTWESFVKGLAWVVIDPLPGQEERNTFHLMEEGVGVWAYEPRTLAHKLERLLDSERLKVMRENSLRMARPDAARRILDTCVELLE
jgi:processive 1,2-diacylglycerol beta-glucosyltransferase